MNANQIVDLIFAEEFPRSMYLKIIWDILSITYRGFKEGKYSEESYLEEVREAKEKGFPFKFPHEIT